MENNSNIQYDRHQDEWQEIINSPDGNALGATWMRDDTLDYWRHERLRKFIVPIIDFESDACWLTVGDGRYGSDGHYLKSCGAQKVHCSDYSDALLKIGAELGYILEFSAQNAEALSFGDGEFDYVFCKDALHHFPRPYIALNEMFRVSRKGVILIEPRDRTIDKPLFNCMNLLLRRLVGRGLLDHGFETVGNYVYTISERELEKYLLGMHFTQVGFASCNDAYFPGVEFASYPPITVQDKLNFLKLRFKIMLLDLLTRMRFVKSGTLIACLFKKTPDQDLLLQMKNLGWSFKNLPKNPYR